ncbi:MAG: LPS export ABC transporter periplasmic protein LptC [Candidatus Eremiobacteraeota bacterium]|nr:LPS export ABC transporter periplasmic protein LptC [Candidatus Eremiobacteraeota bacterium]
MKELKSKNLFFIFILLSVVLIFITGSGCSGKKKEDGKDIKPTASPSTTPTPSPTKKNASGPVVFKGTKLQARRGRLKDWELHAQEVTFDKGRGSARAKVVEVVFFNPEGDKVMTVTANGATVDMENKSLKFLGEVQASASTGEKLTVKKLSWDNKRKLLLGREYVRITRKKSVMTARNMSADPQLKKVTLSGDVRVDYKDSVNFPGF